MPNAPSSLDKTTTTCSAWPAVKPLPRPVPIAVPAPGFSRVSWQTLKGFIEQTTRLMLTAPSWTILRQRRRQTAPDTDCQSIVWMDIAITKISLFR